MTTDEPGALPGGRAGAMGKMLGRIERAGNRLPGPLAMLFLVAILVVLASFVGARRHLSAVHPETGAAVAVTSLLSAEGLRRLVVDAVKSFGGSALGTAIVLLAGLGVAERSGLARVALSALGRRAPAWALTTGLFVVALHAGIAGDTGLFLVPPLGALLFLGMGRHPLAGLAAGYAGVTSGFGAGLLITALDGGLAASTAKAAEGRAIDPAATYFLVGAATVALAVAGVLVNRYFVESSLGEYLPVEDGEGSSGAGGDSVSPAQRHPGAGGAARPDAEARALRITGIVTLVVAVLIAALVVPESGPLRDAGGSPRPFFEALPAIALGLLFLASAVFGRLSGSVPDQRAFHRLLGKAASDLGPYLVLAFAAAQLAGALQASGLGPVLAIKGSRAIGHTHLHGVPLAVGVAGLAAFLGLLVPSATARWGMMASALVPLFVASGLSPEAAQSAFRAGMSPLLGVTPVLPSFAVLAAFAKRFSPRSGTGTLVTLTWPYALAFGLVWLVVLVIWIALGLPLGPGVAVR